VVPDGFPLVADCTRWRTALGGDASRRSEPPGAKRQAVSEMPHCGGREMRERLEVGEGEATDYSGDSPESRAKGNA